MTESKSPATIVPLQPPLQAYLVIVMGVVAVSLAAIFIRLAQGEHIPSLFIGAARMSLATLIITPITLRRYWGEIRRLRRSDFLWVGISGAFLAIHFASWILSLEYTSVLISVVLVNTNPLWVAALEVLFLRAHLGKWVIGGLLIGLIGSLIVAIPPGGAISAGQNPVLGSLLSITGAVTVAAYFVIGRKLRATLSLMPYIWLVYGTAAILLMAVVIVTGVPITGYSSQGYFWLLAMAAVPQLLGHSSFNFVLKYFPATYVGIAVQMEPVFSALIALFLFKEIPLAFQIIGSATILCGVVFASIGQSRSTAAKPASAPAD